MTDRYSNDKCKIQADTNAGLRAWGEATAKLLDDPCRCTIVHTRGCKIAKAEWLLEGKHEVYKCFCGTGMPPNCHRLEECPRSWREQLLRAWENLPDYVIYSLSNCGYPELESVADCELCRRATKYHGHDINVMTCAAAIRSDRKTLARKAFFAGWEASDYMLEEWKSDYYNEFISKVEG